MAVSLSNHYVLTPLRPSDSSSKASAFSQASLGLRNPRRHSQRARLLSPVLGFSCSDSFAVPVTRSSRFASRVAASSSGNESEERSESSDAGEFNLNTLLRVYKEAILVGDRKIVVAVEARVEAIENKSSDLADKVSTLTEEVKSGKQKLVRLQADFDNFRKRSEKERLSVRSNAQGEVIESLLPMVDNFERAKQILKPETDMEKKIDASYQGIYKQFVEIMRSLRVSAVPTVGKPFDPLLHEAIAREESQEFKEGIVVHEFRRGFQLGDRLLRPATVKVSAGPGRRTASTAPSPTAATVDGSSVDASR